MSCCRAGDGLVAAVRDEVPEGVAAVIDTAVLGRTIFPAIREGGALAFVRTWEGDEVEGGITIRGVWVGDVLERTDWLRDIGDLARREVLPLWEISAFPPEHVADAHRQMEAGGLRARPVIVFE